MFNVVGGDRLGRLLLMVWNGGCSPDVNDYGIGHKG